jgi:hypothetical protein
MERAAALCEQKMLWAAVTKVNVRSSGSGQYYF